MPRLSFGPVALALVLWLSGCLPPVPDAGGGSPAPPATAADASTVADAIVRYTNRERSRAGLRPFIPSAKLARAARLEAVQVAELQRLEHVIPGADYPRPEDRIEAVGYAWQRIAENLAMGERDAAGAVADWMRSRDHRANILDPRLTEIGGAYARDRAGRPYYVQVFGRPAP